MKSVSSHQKHRLGYWIVLAAAALLVTVSFWFVLVAPNDYFYVASGDGLQTYFATTFYGLYDHGLWFTGMNYPYGEHFLYPNLQPALALPINWLQRLGIPAASYTIALTNLSALAGLVLAPLPLYAILRRTGLPVAFSIATALLISFLSPQLDRLTGHMTLSYVCFVPWLWYCIIRMDEALPRQWRWHCLFVVSALFQGLTMLYFLASGCMLLLAYLFVKSLAQGVKTIQWRMVLAAILPLLLFRGWIALTDPTTDRPPNPYGILVYNATPAGVFTPTIGPLAPLWRKVTASPNNLEVISYIGLVAVLVLVYMGTRWLVKALRKRRWRALHWWLPSTLQYSLPAAALVLLVAMGFPFILPGADGLVAYIGPLKQLRALGRFAWPFYYVVGVYAAYVLYLLIRVRRFRLMWRWAVVPLLLLVWASEAWLNVNAKLGTIKQGAGAASFLDPAQSVIPQLSWTKWKINDFQAILSLPLLNMGTDKFGLAGSPASTYQAEKLAIASGLPLFASYVSRASVGQASRHVQLLSSSLLPKELLRKLPSTKPLLLLTTPEPHSPAEQRIIDLAHLILTTPEVSLYELPVAALAATTLAEERTKAKALLPALKPRESGVYSTTSKGIYLNKFTDFPDRRGRLEPGAFYEPANAFSLLYDGPVPAPADTGRYEASIWMNSHMAYSLGNLQVVQFVGGQQTDHQVVDAHVATEVDGQWMRIVIPFRVRPGTTRLQVVYDNQDLLADDFMIRPVDTDVYYYVGDKKRQLVKNGYRL